jgi:hypothetical protein
MTPETQNAIKADIKERQLTLDQLLEAYPQVDTWRMRTLFRDAQAEIRREQVLSERSVQVTQEAAVPVADLKQMSARAKEALDIGFFRPLRVELPRIKPVKPVFKKAGRTWGIISDLHAGTEHDWAAIDVAVQVMQAAGIDELVVNGDVFHCESFSRHAPAQEQHRKWVTEREQALPPVAYLHANFQDTPTRVNAGNHDLWPMRWISQNAPVLEGFFTPEQILGIDAFGWTFEETGRIILADQLLVKHGTRVSGNPGESVKKEIMASGMSTVIGHVHRLAYVEHRRAIHEIKDERPFIGLELGCLCSLRPQYLAREDSSSWSQGFAIVTVDESGHLNAELVSIHNGRAHFRGSVFESRLAAGTEYRELAPAKPRRRAA